MIYYQWLSVKFKGGTHIYILDWCRTEYFKQSAQTLRIQIQSIRKRLKKKNHTESKNKTHQRDGRLWLHCRRGGRKARGLISYIRTYTYNNIYICVGARARPRASSISTNIVLVFRYYSCYTFVINNNRKAACVEYGARRARAANDNKHGGLGKCALIIIS